MNQAAVAKIEDGAASALRAVIFDYGMVLSGPPDPAANITRQRQAANAKGGDLCGRGPGGLFGVTIGDGNRCACPRQSQRDDTANTPRRSRYQHRSSGQRLIRSPRSCLYRSHQCFFGAGASNGLSAGAACPISVCGVLVWTSVSGWFLA